MKKLALLAAALAALLVAEELARVAFPWDLRVYSESPFLTTMMQLHAGKGFYAAPGDASSYIYAPGLPAVTYAVLRPFGADLDVRACRAVTVLLGLSAAVAAGAIASRFARGLGDGGRAARMTAVTATSAAALVVFESYTADACHPDNLYALHATALVLLLARAAESKSVWAATLALAFAGVGLLAKQTAAFGCVGAAAVLGVLCGRELGTAKTAVVAAVGGASFVLSAYLLTRGHGRFWTLDLVAREPVQWFRLRELAGQYTAVPYRLLLLVAFGPAALYLFLEGAPELRASRLAWLAVGITEVLPSALSYLKIWGFWNNLTILDLWMALPVLAVGLHLVDRQRAIGLRALGGGGLLTLLVALVPLRAQPTPGQYAFGRALDAALARDRGAGRRVLVSHGASALVRVGIEDVPKDRSVSVLELTTAGVDTSATRERIARRAYDKLYLFGVPYPADVEAAITAGYHPSADTTIPGDGAPLEDELLFGVQSFMHGPVRVMDKN